MEDVVLQLAVGLDHLVPLVGHVLIELVRAHYPVVVGHPFSFGPHRRPLLPQTLELLVEIVGF